MSLILDALTAALLTKTDFQEWQEFLTQAIELESDEEGNLQRLAIGMNTNRIEIDAYGLTLISGQSDLRVSLFELKVALGYLEYLREIIPTIEDGGFIIPGADTTGQAGGDLVGSYPNPELAPVTLASSGSNFLASISVDSKGRVTGINPYDPVKEGFQSHHFIGGHDLFNVSGTGSVPGSYGVGTSTRPGILVNNCLPVANAASFCIQKGSFNAIVFGGAVWRFRTLIRIPTLSVTGDVFNAYIGFLDSSGAAPPSNGCFFVHDNTRGLWCRNVAAGVITEASGGVAIVAGAWYDLTIEISKGNSNVRFFINGVLVQTFTTNIPTNVLAIGYHAHKVAGQPNTSRGIEADYYSLYWNFN